MGILEDYINTLRGLIDEIEDIDENPATPEGFSQAQKEAISVNCDSIHSEECAIRDAVT